MYTLKNLNNVFCFFLILFSTSLEIWESIICISLFLFENISLRQILKRWMYTPTQCKLMNDMSRTHLLYSISNYNYYPYFIYLFIL